MQTIRQDDHSTSVESSKKVKAQGMSRLRQQVYDVLKAEPGGLTDCQIRTLCTQAYGSRSESTYRKRRTELVDLGLVIWSGERRVNAIGNMEKVWELYI